MPVYNSEKYLKSAIESVLNQTFKNFELILIDDGSTDNSYEICNNYYNLDRRIIVIHKINGGICSARNLGLNKASGKYIMFIDNDDILDSCAMEIGINFMNSNNLDLFKFERTEYLVNDEKIIKRKKNRFDNKIYEKNTIIENIIKFRSKQMLTFVWDSIFKKEIIENNKISFNEEYKTGNEDIEFCLMYIQYCNKIMFYNKSLYNHYTRIGFSTSSKNSFNKYEDNIKLAKYSKDVYLKNGVQIDKYCVEYGNIMASSMIYPTCCLINDKNLELKILKKIAILKQLRNNDIFCVKFNILNFIKAFSLSKRNSIYYILFEKKFYFTLIVVDKISRLLILQYRKLRIYTNNVKTMSII